VLSTTGGSGCMEFFVTATSRHVLYSFYHRTSVIARVVPHGAFAYTV